MIGIGIGVGLLSSPASTPTAATGAIDINSLPSVGEQVVVGDAMFVWIDAGGADYSVNIGATPEDCATMLADAITAKSTGGGHGPATNCTAIAEDSHIALTANEVGSAGNDIPLSTDSPAISVTPFSGGHD